MGIVIICFPVCLKMSGQKLKYLKDKKSFWYSDNSLLLSFFYKCRIYAFQVCGQGSSDRLLMVQKAENKALRIMVFMDERNPCEPLFPEAKIPIKPKI